jgi:uncharacterized coiled-coil DUF342 family protein
MNKSETKRMDKLIEASDVILKERDALRRQVSDMEMQRATLVAEQSHDQDKIIALMEDKVSLLEETLKLKATINEMAQITIEGLDKIKDKRNG